MATKDDEQLIMRAIALCFKPYLKPEEAYIYCDLKNTQLNKRLEEFGVYKTASGYYRKTDLDAMMEGKDSRSAVKIKAMRH